MPKREREAPDKRRPSQKQQPERKTKRQSKGQHGKKAQKQPPQPEQLQEQIPHGDVTAREDVHRAQDPASISAPFSPSALAARDYLQSWHDRGPSRPWKFQKNRQTWILKHVFSPLHLSDDSFSLALEYFREIKSESIKLDTLKRAQSILAEGDADRGGKRENDNDPGKASRASAATGQLRARALSSLSQ